MGITPWMHIEVIFLCSSKSAQAGAGEGTCAEELGSGVAGLFSKSVPVTHWQAAWWHVVLCWDRGCVQEQAVAR